MRISKREALLLVKVLALQADRLCQGTNDFQRECERLASRVEDALAFDDWWVPNEEKEADAKEDGAASGDRPAEKANEADDAVTRKGSEPVPPDDVRTPEVDRIEGYITPAALTCLPSVKLGNRGKAWFEYDCTGFKLMSAAGPVVSDVAWVCRRTNDVFIYDGKVGRWFYDSTTKWPPHWVKTLALGRSYRVVTR